MVLESTYYRQDWPVLLARAVPRNAIQSLSGFSSPPPHQLPSVPHQLNSPAGPKIKPNLPPIIASVYPVSLCVPHSWVEMQGPFVARLVGEWAV